MMFEHNRPAASVVALAALIFGGGCGAASPATESPGDSDGPDVASTPATPAEAAATIDLRAVPLFPGSQELGGRSIARLTYSAPTTPREAFDFHRQYLLERDWRESPGSYVSDESASGSFTRDGFTLSLSASPANAASGKPETQVWASNHGNVHLATLPKPPQAAMLYTTPASMAYVTPDGVEAVAKEIDETLRAAGWEPYGSAGDSRYYKQHAVKLGVTTATAPAQAGKTTVSYQTEQLSADLPVPADARQVQYSEPPVQLSVDFPGNLASADAWYRRRLSSLGWEPTTETPIKQNFEHFVIYRNAPGALIEISMREIDDFTRLMLKHLSPEEFAAMEKQLEKQREKQRRAEPAKTSEVP